MIEPRSRGDTASASSTPKCSRPAAADTRSSSAQHVAWQCETRNGNGTACCDVARRERRGAARHTTKCTCHRFLRFGVGRAIGACRRQRSYTRRPRGFVYCNCAGHTVDEPTQARHALESLHTRSVRVRQNIAACARGTNARTPSRQTPAACHTGRRGQKTSHRIAGRQRVCPTSSSISQSRRRKPKASLPRPPPISIIHPLPAGTANMHGISAGAGCSEPAHQDLGLDVCSLHARIQARGERTF